MLMKGVKFPLELMAMGSDKLLMPMSFSMMAHAQAATKDTKTAKFDLSREDDIRDNDSEFNEFDDEDFKERRPRP